MLNRKGYKVLALENDPEGLRACKEYDGRIDLLLTDVVMPHLGGIELACEVMKSRKDIRVFYMLGYTNLSR